MEWISVEERLPEKGRVVLVYISDRKSIMLTHFFDDFSLVRVGMESGFSGHGVTHWMPLPEPPKEKSR